MTPVLKYPGAKHRALTANKRRDAQMQIRRTEQIGGATLYLGDCREIMASGCIGSVGAVITDPPYGMSYQTNYRKVMQTPDKLANDSEAPTWCIPLMADTISNSGAMYLCSQFCVMRQWWDALEEAGLRVKTPIIWDKGNCTAGDLRGDYGNETELILFAHKGRHTLRDGRDRNIWRVPRDPAGEHPTPKPIALMTRCIHNSTDLGDIVFDPFMGSGSTGVAAIRLNRQFIGIEIEEKFFDIACRRIEAEANQTRMELWT